MCVCVAVAVAVSVCVCACACACMCVCGRRVGSQQNATGCLVTDHRRSLFFGH